MQIIPLQAVPNQSVNVTLATQACRIAVRQTYYGLFVDLYVNNVAVIVGVAALNLTRIVRDTYLGFIGDLAFVDMQGSSDPDYTGLGSRYQLVYLSPAEVLV